MQSVLTSKLHVRKHLPSKTVLSFFISLLLLVSVSTPAVVAAADSPQSVIHALDYIAVDYPATVTEGTVVDKDEYTEQLEFSKQLPAAIAALPEKAGRNAIQASTQRLYEQIQAKVDGDAIARSARDTARELARLYEVRLTPRVVPDLSEAAALFGNHCASCHGSQGYGDGPEAATLNPPPINFHDRERAMERSLYGLYNAISLGVEGTQMRPFQELSESQRWALAFYVGNFLFSDQQRIAGEQSWQQGGIETLSNVAKLTQLTPAAMQTAAGENGLLQLAYLRAHPETVMGDVHPLDTAAEKLGASVASYRSGDVEQAYQHAVAAYLEGFELAESSLRASDPDRLLELEQQMMAYRNLIKSQAPLAEVESAGEDLVQALDQVRQPGSANKHLSASAGAVSAAVILLREGLEAILILAAITGVLIKTGRSNALPYLHAGWLAALALGGVTWMGSTHLFAISGADRELTEGITALLAAAVLVYVGFWLHGKSNAKRWREFVDLKIKQALHGRALWMLTLVAFLAVYREVFETVLFYQALWLQTEPQQHISLWGGIGVGLCALLLLGWLILRLSMRLPLHLFFGVNSVILFVLAVAFSGHGIAALQVAGVLPSDPLPWPRFELLGVYPTVETMMAQVVVAALVIFVVMRERFNREPSKSAA